MRLTQAPLAIDGNPSTVWPIDTYTDPVPFPNFKNGVGLMLQLSQPTKVGEVTIDLNSTGTAVQIRSSQTPTPSSLDDTTVMVPATTLKTGSNTIKVDNADADVQCPGLGLHARPRRRQEPLGHRRDHPQSRVLIGGLTGFIPSAANLCQDPPPAPFSVRLWGAARDIDRTDTELLAAHVAGDRYAFEELFYRHHRQLYRLAQMTSRNPEDAADALQDAMLSAHRSAPALPSRLGGQQLAVPHRGQRVPRPVAAQQDTSHHRARGRCLPRRRSDTAGGHRDRGRTGADAASRSNSAPRSSRSTCRATRWPRPRACSALPRAR